MLTNTLGPSLKTSSAHLVGSSLLPGLEGCSSSAFYLGMVILGQILYGTRPPPCAGQCLGFQRCCLTWQNAFFELDILVLLLATEIFSPPISPLGKALLGLTLSQSSYYFLGFFFFFKKKAKPINRLFALLLPLGGVVCGCVRAHARKGSFSACIGDIDLILFQRLTKWQLSC